ncbi:MAG: hypothetical protein SynsKO_31940 [Synoicihabitans sp.]
MIKRILVMATALLGCCVSSSGEPTDKPNVLFIAIDDLNDFVGCMNGSVSAPTPHIDRLAAQGTLFTNAHCQAPICGPSRASIMTGLYPSTTGNYVHVNDDKIKAGSAVAAQSIFMPDYFEQHGYKTMGVGKIYHNEDRAKTFDEYGGGFEWFGPRPAERINYDPSKLPHKIGGTSTDWGVFPEHDWQMPDYKCAAWATEKLNQTHEKPFFLGVGFLRPHVPWYVPQKWFDKIQMDASMIPPFKADDLNDVPELGQRVADVPQMPTTEELIADDGWLDVMHAYLASIAFVDAQIGKVLDALEDSAYADNTVVVLWSDHGYHLGEKNRFAKMSLWERDSRVVLAFKAPGMAGNQVSPASVQLMDIYPTLLELCGLPEYELAEGNSLVPLMHNPDRPWDHRALVFYGEGNIAVRDERYRLIQYEDGSLELYDMSEDPNEWHNLAHDSSHQKIVESLQQSIPHHWAPLNPESTYYDVNPYFAEKTAPLK